MEAVVGPRDGGRPPEVALWSFLRLEFLAGVMASVTLALGCAH
jgi:hypothetical protein